MEPFSYTSVLHAAASLSSKLPTTAASAAAVGDLRVSFNEHNLRLRRVSSYYDVCVRSHDSIIVDSEWTPSPRLLPPPHKAHDVDIPAYPNS